VWCVFCGRQKELVRGRMELHHDGRQPCEGSGQAVTAAALGRVYVTVPLGEATCMACGRRSEVMTVHDGVNAVWPCGHTFPSRPARDDRVQVLVPEQPVSSSDATAPESTTAS
jgi:hypothetical protein